MSNSLRPHGLQHTRVLCPSNSCPLSQWCYPTNSFSVTLFSSCLQPFPASESFPMSLSLRIMWPKYCSFSISPSGEYLGLISFRIDWFDLLAVQGTLKSLLRIQFITQSMSYCLKITYSVSGQKGFHYNSLLNFLLIWAPINMAFSKASLGLGKVL